MSTQEHDPSGPPSPPPPAPDPERLPTGRYPAVTAERVTTIPPEVLHPAELTRRTLRAERIAEEVRANFGRPERMNPDGTTEPATGFWKKMEPVVKMAEIFWKEREEQQQAKTRGRGWFAERGTKLVDGLLPGAVIAAAVAAVAYFARHWHP